MSKAARIFSGLRHRPSIIPALCAEGANILIATSAVTMLVAGIAGLEVINLRPLQNQVFMLITGIAMIGLLVSIFENSPWARHASQLVLKRTGTEHVALWMLLSRLVLLPIVMVVCLYGRREIFYQLSTPANTAGVALSILAIGAYWVLRNKSR